MGLDPVGQEVQNWSTDRRSVTVEKVHRSLHNILIHELIRLLQLLIPLKYLLMILIKLHLPIAQPLNRFSHFSKKFHLLLTHPLLFFTQLCIIFFALLEFTCIENIEESYLMDYLYFFCFCAHLFAYDCFQAFEGVGADLFCQDEVFEIGDKLAKKFKVVPVNQL